MVRRKRRLARALIALALAHTGLGCDKPPPPTLAPTASAVPRSSDADPAPEPRPAHEVAAAAHAPAEPTPPPEPERRVTRANGTTTIVTGDRDEVVLTRGAVAWTEGGQIWLLGETADTAALVHTTPDPHDLVSDGASVFWLGFERNGRLFVADREIGFLPRTGHPAHEDLAWGDALFVVSNPSFFRVEVEPRGIGHVQRLKIEVDPSIKILPGVAAGGRTLYVRAQHRTGPRMLRVSATGRLDVLEIASLPAPWTWAVDGDGGLLQLDTDTGRVTRIARKAKTANAWLDAPGAIALCANDSALATRSATGEAAWRSGRREPATTIATDWSGKGDLECGFGRVAWSPNEGPLVVVDPRSP